MSHAPCCKSKPNVALTQNLDEMDFERGIWSAALEGDKTRVEKLLNKTARPEPDIRDAAGYTALHYAASKGFIDICELLLDSGADIHAETRAGKATALHRAASNGRKQMVEFLLRKGASVFKQDADGRTALHRAFINRQHDIADLLLKKFPDLITIKDNRNKLPEEYNLSSESNNCS